MKSIISFSGGLDSIYVLWKELTETSNDVLAVYFMTPRISQKMINDYQIKALTPQVVSAEIANSIHALSVTIANGLRPFDVSVVYYDWSKLVDPTTGSNHCSVLRTKWAIDRLNAGMADRFVSGHCRDNDGFSDSAATTQNNKTASSLAMDVFKATATRGEYALPLQDYNYTAATAYADMPAWLCDLAISGDENPPDGLSYKNAMHQFAKDKLASGMNKDQFFDYAMMKSLVGNGMWRSQKRWLADEMPSYTALVNKDWPMPDWATSYKVPE